MFVFNKLERIPNVRIYAKGDMTLQIAGAAGTPVESVPNGWIRPCNMSLARSCALRLMALTKERAWMNTLLTGEWLVDA